MSIKEKLKEKIALLAQSLLEMKEVTADNGIVLVYEGDQLAVDTVVKSVDAEGNEVEVADGKYIVEGVEYVIAGGIVTEVIEAPIVEEEVEAVEEPTTEEIVEEMPEEPAVDEIVEEIIAIVPEVAAEDQIDPLQALSDIVTKLVEQLDSMQAQMSSIQEDFSQMKLDFKRISDEPAGKPAEIVVKDTTKTVITDKKIENARNILHSNK